MKLLGSMLLAVGFLAGAYMTVAQVSSVNWTSYGVCIFTMVLGTVFLRQARVNAVQDAGEKHEADIAVLQRSLKGLIAKVRGFEGETDDETQLTLHHRIDAELMEELTTFVEARESMIPRLGMQRYADIMSPFANGERLINRAWSASADGYVDEVRKCVATARSEWEKAAELLAASSSAAVSA